MSKDDIIRTTSDEGPGSPGGVLMYTIHDDDGSKRSKTNAFATPAILDPVTIDR